MLFPLAGQQVVAVEFLQAVPHATQLGPDRPPLRLARMRREDELDRQPVEHLLHVGGGKTERLQFGHPGRQRLPEGLRMPLPFPVAENPNPLPVLGDVDQIEEDAEGPRHEPRLPLVERLDPGRQRLFGVVPSGPAVACKLPHLLHQGECLGAGEFANHRAEHVSQQADIAAQEVVVVHSHPVSRRAGLGRKASIGRDPESIEGAKHAPSRPPIAAGGGRGRNRRSFPRGRPAALAATDRAWPAGGHFAGSRLRRKPAGGPRRRPLSWRACATNPTDLDEACG